MFDKIYLIREINCNEEKEDIIFQLSNAKLMLLQEGYNKHVELYLTKEDREKIPEEIWWFLMKNKVYFISPINLSKGNERSHFRAFAISQETIIGLMIVYVDDLFKREINLKEIIKKYNYGELKKMKYLEMIKDLCLDGLSTDGAHHKQWYLEKILKNILEEYEKVMTLEEFKEENDLYWEEGIPP